MHDKKTTLRGGGGLSLAERKKERPPSASKLALLRGTRHAHATNDVCADLVLAPRPKHSETKKGRRQVQTVGSKKKASKKGGERKGWRMQGGGDCGWCSVGWRGPHTPARKPRLTEGGCWCLLVLFLCVASVGARTCAAVGGQGARRRPAIAAPRPLEIWPLW